MLFSPVIKQVARRWMVGFLKIMGHGFFVCFSWAFTSLGSDDGYFSPLHSGVFEMCISIISELFNDTTFMNRLYLLFQVNEVVAAE